MKSKNYTGWWVGLAIISSLVLLNGIVHVSIYLVDSEPLFSGFRLFHFALLGIGAIAFRFSLKKLTPA
jgi:hypothetical protein